MFFQWLEDLWISTLIRESIWGYPIVGAVHVLGFAWFGGAVLTGNLRRLGWALQGMQQAELAGQLLAWKGAGLFLTLLSGLLLFGAQPLRYLDSVSFRLKMLMLVLVGINAWTLRILSRNETRAMASPWTRLAAGVSISLWILIVFAARGIAYF